MKLLFRPFALIFGLIAARLGASVFRSVWRRIDDVEPPKPTTAQTTMPKVVGAAALEAATMAGFAAAADRAAARAFEYLTGFWPGELRRGEKDKKDG